MSGARSKCHRPPTPAKMLIWRPRRLRSLRRVAARHFPRALAMPPSAVASPSRPLGAAASARARPPATSRRPRRADAARGARRFVAMRPPPLPRMPRRRRPRAPRRWVGAVAAARTPPRAPCCRIRRRTGTACTATRTGRTRTARSAARSTTRRVASRASCPRRSAGASCTANGPALFERGGKPYAHMLDGDGMVLRFEFDDSGRACSFVSRFVRTREFRAEDAADAVVFRGTFGTMRDGGPLANVRLAPEEPREHQRPGMGRPRVRAVRGRSAGGARPGDARVLGRGEPRRRLAPGMFVSAGLPRAVERALGLGGVASPRTRTSTRGRTRAVGWGWRSLVAKRAVEATFWEWDDEWRDRPSSRSAEGPESSLRDDARARRVRGCAARFRGDPATRYVLIQNQLRVSPGPTSPVSKARGSAS